MADQFFKFEAIFLELSFFWPPLRLHWPTAYSFHTKIARVCGPIGEVIARNNFQLTNFSCRIIGIVQVYFASFFPIFIASTRKRFLNSIFD